MGADLVRSSGGEGVTVLTPFLPHGLSLAEIFSAQRTLLDDYLEQEGVREFVAWYYTPMALGFSAHLEQEVTVYDCMDELSAFHGAPPELIEHEQTLFSRAEVVFAGGASLYQVCLPDHLRGNHLAAMPHPQAACALPLLWFLMRTHECTRRLSLKNPPYVYSLSARVFREYIRFFP